MCKAGLCEVSNVIDPDTRGQFPLPSQGVHDHACQLLQLQACVFCQHI